MSRRRIACLGLLAALLLSNAGRVHDAGDANAHTRKAAFGAAEIAASLARANRELAPPELERIASAVVRYSRKYEIDPVIVPSALAGNLATIESNIEGGCFLLADNIRRLGEEDGISAYFWGSDIRGLAYLARVRATREAVLRQAES